MRTIFLACAVTLASTLVNAAPSPISAARIKADVEKLSSDEFLGRGPGEAGEEKTIAYLAKAFEKAGLAPAGENGA